VHLARRGIFDSIGNFFKKVGDGIKDAAKTVGDGIKGVASTIGNGLAQGTKLIGTVFTGNSTAIQDQADATKDAFDNGFKQTNAQVHKDAAQVATDFSKAGKYLEQFGQAVVELGKKVIQGIVAIAKKVWSWIVAHKAMIAGIVAGFIVSTLVFAGLTLTTMNPILAGAIAGAAGGFVGSEVKQVVTAADNGTLRAPTSAADFFKMAGQHLKNDIVPTVTGGLGGAVGTVVGQAVGEAASGAIGNAFGVTEDQAAANGIGDVLSSSGDQFGAKASQWVVSSAAGGGSNTVTNQVAQQTLGLLGR